REVVADDTPGERERCGDERREHGPRPPAGCRLGHRDPPAESTLPQRPSSDHAPPARRATAQRCDSSRSASSAPSTCTFAFSSPVITLRTTPSRSITNVTRFGGNHPPSRATPNALAIVASRSASSGKPSPCAELNFWCDSAVSPLTPITTPPADE